MRFGSESELFTGDMSKKQKILAPGPGRLVTTKKKKKNHTHPPPQKTITTTIKKKKKKKKKKNNKKQLALTREVQFATLSSVHPAEESLEEHSSL